MWLDRFSAHPTPSATPPPQGGRPYSPAPRRSHLTPGPLPPRPGVNQRSASLLSLASTSTSSLPSTTRQANGSALKHEVFSSPPADVPDPLEVLHNIIGSHVKKSKISEDKRQGIEVVQKPEEVVEDVDFGGLSLQAFAAGDDAEAPPTSDVYTYTAQSIGEYDKERDRFEDLHRSILACDEVLDSVENYLTGFQADLGAVSAEIETLQSRSAALNTKLENRRVVEKLLGPAVEEFTISPAVVRKISEGPIDEGWIKALAEVEKRAKVVNARAKEETKTKAVEDLKPLLEDLTNKAVERIRDYIVGQIKALRSPNMNAQIIQQQAFLKYKDLYAFLAQRQPQLANEIGQAYINTMRWYYQNHFTRYKQALEKLKLHTIDKNDVLGNLDDPSKRSALLSNSRTPSAPHDAFSLGRRLDVLKTPSTIALPSHIVEDDKSTHYLEVPFRSFNLALIDNASFEYTFLTTFFSPSYSHHAISRTFTSIFEPTFALGQALTKQLIDPTLDALGVLLAVRLNQHFAFQLQRRKVPAVEGYINATNMLLWPRFQIVMDLHCDSIRRAAAALPGRTPTAASILNVGSALGGGASASSSAAGGLSTAPHPLTQRFANFLAGVLALSSEAGDDEPVAKSLGRLRAEFEAYLTRLSKGIAEQRKRDRFLANNYSLVGTVLEGVEGRLAEEVRRHFGGLREACGG